MKRVLTNVALDFPNLSYYQGMNYLVIYIYSVFEDELMTYKFLHFISDKFLQHQLEKSFQGVMEMIFLSDKLMQITSPQVFAKLKAGQMSSIHFSVSLLITMFSTLIKDPAYFPIVHKVWDLFIVDGFQIILKSQLLVLKIQENWLLKIPDDEVLMGMKDIEKHLWCVAQYAGASKEQIQELENRMCKLEINKYEVDTNSYKRLVSHYWTIHSPIQKYWNEDD